MKVFIFRKKARTVSSLLLVGAQNTQFNVSLQSHLRVSCQAVLHSLFCILRLPGESLDWPIPLGKGEKQVENQALIIPPELRSEG